MTGLFHLRWCPQNSPMLQYVRISFLLGAEWCSIVNMYHILFIHLSIYGLLGRFPVLAFVKDAAMNRNIQISLWDTDLNSLCVYFGWSCCVIVLFFIFWAAAMLFSIVSVPFYSHFASPSTLHRVPFSPSPDQHLIFFLFCMCVCFFK